MIGAALGLVAPVVLRFLLRSALVRHFLARPQLRLVPGLIAGAFLLAAVAGTADRLAQLFLL